MRVYIDEDLCIGCGLCASIEPSVFEMGEDNFSHVIGDVTDDNEDTVHEAVESCPVEAIKEE